MSQPGKRPPNLSPADERTDLYLMHPRNASSDNMKTRLAVNENLNLQDGPVLVRAGKFHPSRGAILIYHLNRSVDVEMVRQQILDLARSSHGNYNNVVVCGIRGGENLRTMIEALPQTTYMPGDVPGHDTDLVLLKMMRRWKELAAVAAASQDDKQNTGPFIEVTQSNEQIKLVKDAVDSKALVVISPYGSQYKVKGHFFAFDEQRQVLRCQLDGDPEEIKQCMTDADTSKRIALSLALKQSRVFFATTAFHWAKDSLLEIKIPSLLYFVQRRKKFRHNVYAEGRHTLAVMAGLVALTCDIHDVSEGGLSLICTAEEFKALKNASEITGGRFQIEGQSVQVELLKLRHAQKFRSGRGAELFQVGLSFEKILPSMTGIIAKFVNERAARYFQAYLIRR